MLKKLNYTDYFSIYSKLFEDNSNTRKLDEVEKKILKLKKDKKGKIILLGNGGSAAAASHLMVDFTKQAKIKSINFNEVGLVTAFANDYGYDKYLQKALDFYADKNDIVILISVSGNSANLVNAAKYCVRKSIFCISFTGSKKKNKLNKLSNIFVHVKSNAYNIVECMHLMYLTYLVDKIIGKIVYKVN
jgi:D-sedoheptulose 7-phosphate isomerase